MRQHCAGLVALLAVATTQPAQAVPPPTTTTAFRERQQRREAFRNERVRGAVHGGTAWLLAHQDDDGGWDCDDFGKHDAADARCDGEGMAVYDIGVTSLALLALLAQAEPAHHDACQKAARWLASAFDGNTGRVRSTWHDFIYEQAMATLALAETAELLDDAAARTAAARGMRYLERHRNPGAAWRYQPRDGDNDTSATSWCIAAATACRSAGIEVAPADIGQALAWIETVTDQTTGRSGYSKRDVVSARMPGEHSKRFPADRGEATTAAAIHARRLVGLSVPYANRADYLLLAKPPVADPPAIDFYYWLHGSQAFGVLTGSPSAKVWESALQKVLLGLQQTKGPALGSWDPTDVWGVSGGRVYATAANVLALSAPFRCRRLDENFVVPDTPPWRRVHSIWNDGKYGVASIETAKVTIAADDGGNAAVRARIDWHIAVYVARAERLLADLEAAAPDLLARYELLRALAQDLAPLPVGAEATRQLAAIEKEPMLRNEVQASRELDRLRDDYDALVTSKNKSKRQQLRKQLEKLVEHFPDTAASVKAIGMIEQLR